MKWIWQRPDWPDLRCDDRTFEARELEFRINSARLAGRFEALPIASRQEATIDLMLSDAIKTSAIEGENLHRESLRPSLLSLMVSDTLPNDSDRSAAGAASLLVGVRRHCQIPLTHDLLGKWQSMVVPQRHETYADRLNGRQARMIRRVFAEGRKGFTGGITIKKYTAITRCPNRTASRDLADLLARGVIAPLPGGGRAARYALTRTE